MRDLAVMPTLARTGYKPNLIVLGKVVGIHISDDVLSAGLIDHKKLQLIARLGYDNYARVDDVFTMVRPD